MREARHHLAAAGRPPRPLEHDMTRAYCRNVLRALPYYLLLIIAIVAAATFWQPLTHLVPGAVVVIAMTLAMAAAARRFLSIPDTPAALNLWRTGFVLADLVHATGWFAVLLPFLIHEAAPSHPIVPHVFVLFVVMILLGLTAILRAPLPICVQAGMTPLTLLVLLVSFTGDGREETAFSLITLGVAFFLLYFAGRLHQAAVATFRSRVELRANVAELEQTRANTAHARQRAEEAERAKSQFLATVGHELRTPLNAILGFSEVMKNEVLGSHSTPSYREYSSDIHGSGQYLLSLINEILELARIESGRYELNEEVICLAAVVESVCGLMTERAEAKDQRMAVLVEPGLEEIRLDRRAVRQILLNLLSNAIKFTPPGGQITVKAGWTSRGGQYVSIADNGPGIPPDEIPVALSSFGRGSLAISTAARGAGLGLPIAKGLVDLHGGRFVLKSEPRAGTQAIVVFPESRVEAARPPELRGSIQDAA